MDTHNYFFRLDRNAAFFRREMCNRENLGEGGMLFRAPGSVSWTRFDSVDDVAKSPAAKAAVVPILLKVLEGRSEYDRLNGKPHHGDDFGYAQAKAVSWLSRLIPAGDSNYRDVLVRAFPTMNVDGVYAAWFRLQSEGEGRALEHALIAMLDDPVRASTARSLLRQISPVDSVIGLGSRRSCPSSPQNRSGPFTSPYNFRKRRRACRGQAKRSPSARTRRRESASNYVSMRLSIARSGGDFVSEACSKRT
jgi:hypothetical protein